MELHSVAGGYTVTYMNTNRPNKFSANCATCATRVAAGAGTLGPKVAGKWTTRCAACTPAARPAARRFADNDDDGFDARKDAACVNGTWKSSRRGW